MKFVKYFTLSCRNYSATKQIINDKTFESDSFTNITPRILSRLNVNLFNQREHPLCLLKERIVQFFYTRFKNSRGNPLFSVYDNLSPIVTTYQNFDSLLVPPNHPSRSKSDCYYINREYLLRAHMTAHQSELLRMGLDNFLMIGDVYRRDDINSSHYPVFHQLDAVRLFTPEMLFIEQDDGRINLEIMEKDNLERTSEKQEVYSLKASKMAEAELKKTLVDLSKDLFGDEVKYQWVDAFFPFTHPSWELEVFIDGKWLEMLGCGIMEYDILKKAGVTNKIGWAFGLGLERLAMVYYSIPDIRLFWSTDPGFHYQFQGKTYLDRIKFKPFSVYPPCPFDISFWISEGFESNDFYELAREQSGDIIEQIQLVDSFKHPITGRESRCYRITYRSMDKIFTKEELNAIHKKLEQKVADKLKVEVR